MIRRKNTQAENPLIVKRSKAIDNNGRTKEDDRVKRQRMGLSDLSNAMTSTLHIGGDRAKDDNTKDGKPKSPVRVRRAQGKRRTRSANDNSEEDSDCEMASIVEAIVLERKNERDDWDYKFREDPFNVCEYACDIFKYYMSREAHFQPDDYMHLHKLFGKGERAQLVDWMVMCQEQFDLNHEVIYHAVRLFDLFLSRTHGFQSFEFIAAVSLIIAAKLDVQDSPSIDDFRLFNRCASRYTIFAEMEKRIISKLDFDLNSPVAYRFLRRFSRIAGQNIGTLTLARYVLETSLMFYEFIRVPDSLMAAASLALAMRVVSRDRWLTRLERYSGYSKADVEPLMMCLNHMMNKCGEIYPSCGTISEKYSHDVFFRAAQMDLLYDIHEEKDTVFAPPKFSLKQQRLK